MCEPFMKTPKPTSVQSVSSGSTATITCLNIGGGLITARIWQRGVTEGSIFLVVSGWPSMTFGGRTLECIFFRDMFSYPFPYFFCTLPQIICGNTLVLHTTRGVVHCMTGCIAALPFCGPPTHVFRSYLHLISCS